MGGASTPSPAQGRRRLPRRSVAGESDGWQAAAASARAV